MYLNITVATPPIGNGISHKPIKGTKYVYYEHGRRYDPKRGYTVQQTTSIGKICEDDDSVMYPNANYLRFSQRQSCRKNCRCQSGADA